MPPVCLVCGKPLKAAGGGVNMYYCDKRKEWVSDFGLHLDVTDTVIYIDPDKRQPSMWVVEIPPYRFTMANDASGPRTVVHKTVLPDWAPWDKDIENKEIYLHKKLILTVPTVMNLPWHDKRQVFDRLKLYLLFS